MKAKTYTKFKNLLIKACDRHIKNGGKLIHGAFTLSGGYCPIFCVLGGVEDIEVFEALNKKLKDKVVERDYWNFIDGFDGNTVFPERAKSRLFKLGRKLREKYSPTRV